MKRLYLFVIFMLLTCFTVNAGRSIPLDFNEKGSYIITLYKGDRVYFEFDNDVHSIILDDLKVLDKRIELDIFLYQNTKFNKHPPQYAFLDIYRTLKIDADKDSTYDFEIKISSFDEKKAILTFTKINEKKDTWMEEIINDDNPTADKYSFYKDWKIIVGILIVIILFIIYLINNYIRNKKDTYY